MRTNRRGCGQAVNFSQTLYLAATLRPDVILLDLHMPDGDTFESAFVKLRLLSIGTRILAMSLWQDEETQIIAHGYGAVELLDKGKLFNELIPAIHRLSHE